MARTGQGWSHRRSLIAPLLAGVALGTGVGLRPAAAQTWTGGRTTPRLLEFVSVDATGEPLWPFGTEDVAGDGDAFGQPEQAIDLRTAYAAADMRQLWLRAYVSSTEAFSADATVLVFVDADGNPATGGTARAPEIDARLTSDPSPGGYEHVIALRGNRATPQIWTFTQPPGRYEPVNVPDGQAAIEAGVDRDPVLVNSGAHGYVQGAIARDLVGVAAVCGANLYFRSVNEAQALGAGDLDVGDVGPCAPADADGDRVPDILVPPSGCKADAECPAGGVCVGGACVLPVPCASDDGCEPDEQCTPDGRCVPQPAGSCTSSATCGDLVCEGGQCIPCSPGDAACGAGRRCAPTGRCVEGIDPGGAGTGGAGPSGAGPSGAGGSDGLSPGDEVRGGACACRTRPAPDGGLAAALLAVGGLALRFRRSPRTQRRARRSSPAGR